MSLFSILITRNDHLIAESWLQKHSDIFDKISVVDGSEGDITEKLCSNYDNVIYSKDSEIGIPVNGRNANQLLRQFAFSRLLPYLSTDDWVCVSHFDEFYYHDPRKIVEAVEPHADLVIFNVLNFMPHPSEKVEALEQFSKGSYDPTKVFKHYWYRSDNSSYADKSGSEHRMFKVLPEMHWNQGVHDRVVPLNVNSLSGIRPLHKHYKIFNFDLQEYFGNQGVFSSSCFDTGLFIDNALPDNGVSLDRSIKEIDNLFFDENNVWNANGYNEFSKFETGNVKFNTLDDQFIFEGQ